MSIKVVQLIHPGGEHSISRSQIKAGKMIKEWNYGSHLRKYLHASGAYIKNEEKIEEKDIYFWGEWEPDSNVSTIDNPGVGAYPHFIHEPFVEFKESGQLVVPEIRTINDKDNKSQKLTPTNTDPFVFGEDGFYYSYCNQEAFKTLQELEPGSIILFGSNKKSDSNINHNEKSVPYFALDTVFVVGPKENKQKFNKNSYLKDLESFVPEHYSDIMNMKTWGNNSNYSCNGSASCGSSKNGMLTCYRGASYDNPVNGMYSFLPCKIGSEGEKGFERVRLYDTDFTCIRKEAIISNKKSQGVKFTETNIEENLAIWTKLRKIIEKQKCYEAVRLDYTIK